MTREELEKVLSALEVRAKRAPSTDSFFGLYEDILGLSHMLRETLKCLDQKDEALKFYGDESKWFEKEHLVNLQETTAVFHVPDPKVLPTEFKSKSWECSARIKIDHGQNARRAAALKPSFLKEDEK